MGSYRAQQTPSFEPFKFVTSFSDVDLSSAEYKTSANVGGDVTSLLGGMIVEATVNELSALGDLMKLIFFSSWYHVLVQSNTHHYLQKGLLLPRYQT